MDNTTKSEKENRASEEMFVNSEKGTRAAWRGFTSQTLYIANRLMLLEDESEFFPEKVEDLLKDVHTRVAK
jgi:hypothetical protein